MSDPSTPTRPRPEPLTKEHIDAFRHNEFLRSDGLVLPTITEICDSHDVLQDGYDYWQRIADERMQRWSDQVEHTTKIREKLEAELAALRQSLVALTAEVEDWRKRALTNYQTAQELADQKGRAEAQRTEAEQALAGLKEWLAHHYDCELRANARQPPVAQHSNCKCTCGLDDVLARLTPQGTPQDQETGT